MPSAIREKLIIGFDANELAEMDQSHEHFLNLIKESSVDDFHEKYKVFQESHPNTLKNLQNRFVQNANQIFKIKFEGRACALHIPLPLSNSTWIDCRGSISNQYFECIVSCGHWHKLKPTRQEINARSLNLMDHLEELLPPQGKDIGFFTFQNGIDNLKKDLIDMGNSILQHLPEKPLCIGIYNPTKGRIHDLSGVLEKLSGLLSDTICTTCQFFTTLADKVFKINPELYWAYIAHSEGGLIAETALTLLKKLQWITYFQKNLLIATYGSVLPIPKNYANAINTYSSKDGATLPRVESYLKSLKEKASDYEIKIIETQTSNLPFLPFGFTGLVLKAAFERIKGDHDFQSGTYQNALKKDINEFFRYGGRKIYNGK